MKKIFQLKKWLSRWLKKIKPICIDLILTQQQPSQDFETIGDFGLWIESQSTLEDSAFELYVQSIFKLPLPHPAHRSLIFIPESSLTSLYQAYDNDNFQLAIQDDLFLGWSYQFWHETQRHALDEKIQNRQKVQQEEISAKTQIFTEDYLVDWILQNTLYRCYQRICKAHQWEIKSEFKHVFQQLNELRSKKQSKMPIDRSKIEAEFKVIDQSFEGFKDFKKLCYVVDSEQKIYEDQPQISSFKDLKILDPAMGTGHFLIKAVDLLFSYYEDEAAHRGECWSKTEIFLSIFQNNLYGLDLDPYAIKLSCLSFLLKMNHVLDKATYLKILPSIQAAFQSHFIQADLPLVFDDKHSVTSESLISADLFSQSIQSIQENRLLGSLIDFKSIWTDLIQQQESLSETQKQSLLLAFPHWISMLRSSLAATTATAPRASASQTLFDRLQDQYDLVIGNPPYQGANRLSDRNLLARSYPLGKNDLYSAFMMKGLNMLKTNGLLAMLTMRNWLFLKQYQALRQFIFSNYNCIGIADLDYGAFDQMGGVIVSVCIGIFQNIPITQEQCFVLDVRNEQSNNYVDQSLKKKWICLFQPKLFWTNPLRYSKIEDAPFLYWWSDQFLNDYLTLPKLNDVCEIKIGLQTGDNQRFVRRPWEVPQDQIWKSRFDCESHPKTWDFQDQRWVPFIKGADGQTWFEAIRYVIDWQNYGLAIRLFSKNGKTASLIRNEKFFFKQGIAYSTIGHDFHARLHLYRSIFDVSGASVFSNQPYHLLVLLNRSLSKQILNDLNPSVNFQANDVKKLPYIDIKSAEQYIERLWKDFQVFDQALPCAFVDAKQKWSLSQARIQQEIDQVDQFNLGPSQVNEPSQVTELSIQSLLFQLNAILIDQPIPYLFMDRTLSDRQIRELLQVQIHFQPLIELWENQIKSNFQADTTLFDFIVNVFFDFHFKQYEEVPIYWPLSSKNKQFVLWVHYLKLQAFLDDFPHLHRLILGENVKRITRKIQQRVDRAPFDQIQDLRDLKEELIDWWQALNHCFQFGCHPNDLQIVEVHQPYAIELSDGVLVNSAAFWRFLRPFWKAPQELWRKASMLSWSKLALRYWPSIVEKDCQNDPSVSASHQRLWFDHPMIAWSWELRLQGDFDEVFMIREIFGGGDILLRERWVLANLTVAIDCIEEEAYRRMGRGGDKRAVLEIFVCLPIRDWARDQVELMEKRVRRKQGVMFEVKMKPMMSSK